MTMRLAGGPDGLRLWFQPDRGSESVSPRGGSVGSARSRHDDPRLGPPTLAAAAGARTRSGGRYAVGTGLFRVFRFYVGRGMPSDLADTGNLQHIRPVYPLKTLKDMLMSRINRTFIEPAGWLSRLLHSLVGNMLFLTPPLRNVAQA